jgi:hypothetical protein
MSKQRKKEERWEDDTCGATRWLTLHDGTRLHIRMNSPRFDQTFTVGLHHKRMDISIDLDDTSLKQLAQLLMDAHRRNRRMAANLQLARYGLPRLA